MCCLPRTTHPPMEHLSILLAVLCVDSDCLSAACHDASCRAPDCAAFSHQDASQPCEASFAVCESCSGWWVAQKSWNPPRSIQFESSASRAAKLSIPRWLLQCKSVYYVGLSLWFVHVVWPQPVVCACCVMCFVDNEFIIPVTQELQISVAIKWVTLLLHTREVPGLVAAYSGCSRFKAWLERGCPDVFLGDIFCPSWKTQE